MLYGINLTYKPAGLPKAGGENTYTGVKYILQTPCSLDRFLLKWANMCPKTDGVFQILVNMLLIWCKS